MPHIRLEYSDNLPALESFAKLFADIHRVLSEQGGIKLDNCKSRAQAVTNCFIADGAAEHAFIDLQIEFLSGRSQEVKTMIGEACLEVLKTHYAAQLTEHLQITVGVHDIPRESYFKFPFRNAELLSNLIPTRISSCRPWPLLRG